MKLARARKGTQRRANGVDGLAADCKGSRSACKACAASGGMQRLERARKGKRCAQDKPIVRIDATAAMQRSVCDVRTDGTCFFWTTLWTRRLNTEQQDWNN
eukprot:10141261-Alexandrium_andersonii.AAC.1